MVARSLSLHLRPNRVEEFTRIIDHEVIPMVRGLKGFQDKIVLVASGGLEAIGLSFWDEREDAEAYGRGTFRHVVKALAKVVEGTPRVETREVSNSTFHTIPGHVAACRQS
jgi:heme-degrading monooxygenase HmoA